ncbi:MAG: enolase [Clostridia bacterium]|nr:enolase [Clostridia bacterium]
MRSTSIKSMQARAGIDCKGKPILEVDIYTQDGVLGRASSPSGISAGEHEAFVLRDGDMNWHDGNGVFKAIKMVENVVFPAIKGMDVMDQAALDQFLCDLDGTPNKAKLGGNVTYSVSLAVMRAAANTLRVPQYKYLNPGKITTIPLPTSDMFAGGSYEKDTMPMQECTVIPYKVASIAEATHILCKMYKILPEVIKEYQGGRRAEPGVQSAFVCPSPDFMVAFDLLYETAVRAGCENKIAFHADCAFSEIYIPDRGTYDYLGQEMDLDEILGRLKILTEKYNFLYIEDPVDENDWDGWVKAAKVLNRTVLCGDDLTVTNKARLQKSLDLGACNSFVFKPNQVGTVTEAMEAQEFAIENGMFSVPSIRAGGVNDDPVADMGIAGGAAAIKQGPPKNGQAIHIINTLTRAEEEIPGAKPFDFTPYIKF